VLAAILRKAVSQATIPKMEGPMKKSKLPKTDSIEKLAEFWDNHELTDFEDELEMVAEPVFVRSSAIKVPLHPTEAEAVGQMARAKGISREELIRTWVVQKLPKKPVQDRKPRTRSAK